MSKQLVKLVSVARPALMAAAQQQLAMVRMELASMPPVSVLGDRHAELLRLIDDISHGIQVKRSIWMCAVCCSASVIELSGQQRAC